MLCRQRFPSWPAFRLSPRFFHSLPASFRASSIFMLIACSSYIFVAFISILWYPSLHIRCCRSPHRRGRCRRSMRVEGSSHHGCLLGLAPPLCPLGVHHNPNISRTSVKRGFKHTPMLHLLSNRRCNIGVRLNPRLTGVPPYLWLYLCVSHIIGPFVMSFLDLFLIASSFVYAPELPHTWPSTNK